MMMQMLAINLGNGQNQCKQISCGHGDGSFTEIRFPFQLLDDGNGNSSIHCGYPGFGLSCAYANQTMLQFPSNPALEGVSLFVESILYESRLLYASDLRECLPRLFLQLYNSSIHPFQFDSHSQFPDFYNSPTKVTFFNCSPMGSTPRNPVHWLL